MSLTDMTSTDMALETLVPDVRRGDAARTEPVVRPRRTRPLSEYWDVETARWRSRGPVPQPRSGD